MGAKMLKFFKSKLAKNNIFIRSKRVGLIAPGHPRTPKDTPGHTRIPQAHLISYIIHLFTHLFIHSDENKAKMASYYFHFQVHSFEKVLLNTANTDLLTYN